MPAEHRRPVPHRPVTAPATQDGALPGLDIPRVSDWLAAHLPGTEPPFTFVPVTGGGSNLTFRVTDAQGTSWALRRPPLGSLQASAHDMAREVRLMSALAASPVPVPPVDGFCEDTAVTGAPFSVMGFVEGRVIRDRASVAGMSRADADVATDSLVDTHVALHTLDPAQVGLGGLSRHEDYVGRQLARWRRQVDRAAARDLPLVAELHDRLVRHQPTERVRPGLAHGDYRFDNVVLDERFGMAAVLDWELCTIGDPIADFAWSLEYWAGDAPVSFLPDPPTADPVFVGRDEVVRRYGARCGYELGDLSYYRVFSWWKQACIAEGAYARQLAAAAGGSTARDPAATARHVDRLLEYAAELASGVV
jgi:aminoglycoside phosphotransferase (APT) family kinase protein